MTETDYPAIYQTADGASITIQKNFLIVLAIYFICLITAAILSVINGPTSIFASIQTFLLLTGLGLTIYLANKQPQRIWYGTRALAESIKTITWRYMMRAEPFDNNDTEAKKHFLASLRKILQSNKKISAQATEIINLKQITDNMLVTRAKSLHERKLVYKEYRIENQQAWYANKANINRKKSKYWFFGLIAMNSTAISFSIGKIIWPHIPFWPTDIFVIAAGAIMTWMQVNRYQELAASYTLAAHEIGLLNAELPEDQDEKKFSLFVSDAENAFSREHTQWQARRDAD